MFESVVKFIGIFIFSNVLFASSLTNPNRPRTKIELKNVGMEAFGQFFTDNWGNQYQLFNASYGTVRGNLVTQGCSARQEILGKTIDGETTLIAGSTESGDCLGGVLVIRASEGGFAGTWKSPINGEIFQVTLLQD